MTPSPFEKELQIYNLGRRTFFSSLARGNKIRVLLMHDDSDILAFTHNQGIAVLVIIIKVHHCVIFTTSRKLVTSVGLRIVTSSTEPEL
jgi:hypothetical protein